MEMPIISPSMTSYADELNFNQLIKDLLKNKHNGFIRVTAGSYEGYILFKEGNQVAASYDRSSKSEAVEKIKSVIEDNNTLIEVFNLKKSPIDYIISLNKPYIIESDHDIYDVIGELKNSDEIKETKVYTESKSSTQTTENESEPIIKEKSQINPEPVKNEFKNIDPPNSEINSTPEKFIDPIEITANDASENSSGNGIEKESSVEPMLKDAEVKLNESNLLNAGESSINEKYPDTEPQIQPDTTGIEEVKDESDLIAESEVEPIDRLKLLKKYGIKPIDEKDVDNILHSYKGGSLNDDDVEKIEFTLMNKIKKSILGIPKTRGAEVLVFLDNTRELSGNINIIIEYESKGFFSRMIGASRDIENLRRQIINIVQIEIKKSFRKYPEIIDNFDVKVEIG